MLKTGVDTSGSSRLASVTAAESSDGAEHHGSLLQKTENRGRFQDPYRIRVLAWIKVSAQCSLPR
jgi:hypothetical protein